MESAWATDTTAFTEAPHSYLKALDVRACLLLIRGSLERCRPGLVLLGVTNDEHDENANDERDDQQVSRSQLCALRILEQEEEKQRLDDFAPLHERVELR